MNVKTRLFRLVDNTARTKQRTRSVVLWTKQTKNSNKPLRLLSHSNRNWNARLTIVRVGYWFFNFHTNNSTRIHTIRCIVRASIGTKHRWARSSRDTVLVVCEIRAVRGYSCLLMVLCWWWRNNRSFLFSCSSSFEYIACILFARRLSVTFGAFFFFASYVYNCMACQCPSVCVLCAHDFRPSSAEWPTCVFGDSMDGKPFFIKQFMVSAIIEGQQQYRLLSLCDEMMGP